MARTTRLTFLHSFLGLVILVVSTQITGAADLAVKRIDKEPPKEAGDSIKMVLTSKAVQLLDGGKTAFEFWFRSEIPLKSKAESPTKALQAIGEATLCGVVSVQADARDYKDNEIPPGLYTARFANQPQDGDHLGTAEFAYFLVLIPIQEDTQLNGISAYKPMVKASGKATPSGHPIVLSLRPGISADGEFPKLSEPAPDHKSISLKLPAKAPDSDQPTSVVFDLVFKGKGKV